MSDEEPLLEGQTVGNGPRPEHVARVMIGLALWVVASGVLLVML